MTAIIDGETLEAWMFTSGTLTVSKQILLEQAASAADTIIRRWCTIPTAGTPAVEVIDDDLILAALIHAARLYRRSLTPDGIAVFGDLGVMRVNKFDSDVQALLEPFINWAGMVG